jgi:hypothetical protein
MTTTNTKSDCKHFVVCWYKKMQKLRMRCGLPGNSVVVVFSAKSLANSTTLKAEF